MDGPSAHHLEDIELAAAISAAMHRDHRIPPDVTVDVSNGVVTLEGHVLNAPQAAAARKLVRHMAPGAPIVDALTIRPAL